MANRVFALLVGIDRYANPYEAPHLRGCVADVEGTYSLLVNRFGIAPDNIRMLTARLGEQEEPETLPTRANIVRGWREHLAQAGAGDVVFFHYSGHGSQSRSVDPNEPDGYDETLVPHDSRTPGVYDLADKELAELIRRVEGRGAQVLIFLDCCHAGSGTRGVEQARIRRCRPDERVRPPTAYLEGLRLRRIPNVQMAPSGWLPQGKHVLLAVCRDDELSYEYRAPGTKQWHGVASYFFQRTLAAADHSITWAAIHDQVLAQVHALYPAQSPQLEGPGHLTLFGDAGLAILPYLLVMAVEGDEYVQVNGGAAVGLTPGSRLAIFGAGTDLTGPPDAIALIEEIAVDHAWAKLDRICTIEPGARAKIVALGLEDSPYGVLTDDAILRKALVELGGGELAGFLQPVGSKEESPAAFVVTVEQGCYVVRDHTGIPLWDERPPASGDGAVRVAETLRHLAIYRNVQRLHNPAPPAGLHGQIELEAVVYHKAGRSGQSSRPLYDTGHSAVIHAGQKLQLTIHNHSKVPAYVALFNLDADFGIARIYPPHTVNQKIAPGESVVIEPIVPPLRGPYRACAVETIKVVATEVAASLDVLQLPKLGDGSPEAGVRADVGSTLGQLLNAVRRQGVRDLVLELDDASGSWTTAQVEVTVVAPPERHLLPHEQPRVALDAEGGWTIDKPEDWAATVLLADLTHVVRGQSQHGPVLPPGLSNPSAREFFRPVLAGETTSSGPGTPIIMGIAAPGDALARVTPDSPLRIELAVADEPELVGIVPIAYDGRHFYVAGKPEDVHRAPAYTGGVRRLACQIDRLPPSTETAGGARDLRRTARLFFYKIFTGALPSDTGVRMAQLEDGRVVYAPVTKDAITQADRVALMLHGFTGESRGLVEKVWPWVKPLGRYDLCLTYDYETFGTGLRQQAEQLAAALVGFGFGEPGQPRLDVYGYSAGGLIGRALVELCSGDDFIDRLFMGGVPNGGTPLAKAGRLLPWLANIGINLAGAVPAALIAHWLLERISDAGQGLSDLAPDSDFIQEINAPWRPPALVPYYLQIGDNSMAFSRWNLLAQRLMQRVDSGLDILFAGDNDLVVGVQSARSLEGRWPRLTTRVVGGHHFQYFHSPESRRVLAEWLATEHGGMEDENPAQ